MRVNFYSLFKSNSDGSYSPTATIKSDSGTISSADRFYPGQYLALFNIDHHAGRDLDVTRHSDGSVELNGIL